MKRTLNVDEIQSSFLSLLSFPPSSHPPSLPLPRRLCEANPSWPISGSGRWSFGWTISTW